MSALLAAALALALALLPSGPVLSRPIVVAAPAGADSAGYVAIASPAADRLVAVRCGCAEKVEIHRIVRAEGKVSMRTEEALEIPAAAPLEIRPGSDLHLMLMGLKQELRDGGVQEMTLVFERAGAVTLSFRVAKDSRAAWAAAQP